MTGEIRTFLIADVRGYTLFTQERGDEAAAKLAAKFASIARETVEPRGGSVVELRGDEALVVFSSPREALRAAMDLQTRFARETVADPTLPLPVGIGLDAGEAVAFEGGYRGGALNLAARLCGQAGPGEVLASPEVVHLARKVEGLAYVDRGSVRLKGLADSVRMIRVVPEHAEDPASVFSRVLAPPKPSPGSSRPPRRRRALLAGGGAALVAIAAVIAVLATGGSGRPTVPPTSPRPAAPGALVVINRLTGLTTGSIQVPKDANLVTAGGGSVWVAETSGWVARIGERTGRTVGRVHTDGIPSAMTFSAGGQSAGVWIASSGSGVVTRIDPASGKVAATVDVGPGVAQVATQGDQVWGVDPKDQRAFRINPVSNLVVSSFSAETNAKEWVAIGPDSVWVLTHGVDCPIPGFCELDASLSRVNGTSSGATEVGVVNRAAFGIAFAIDGQTAWVLTDGGTGLVRVNLRKVGHVKPQSFPKVAVTTHGAAMTLDASGNPWVIQEFSRDVYEVSTVQTQIAATIALPAQPIAITADDTNVYVLLQQSG
jgi:class 3 adenylate cyclase